MGCAVLWPELKLKPRERWNFLLFFASCTLKFLNNGSYVFTIRLILLSYYVCLMLTGLLWSNGIWWYMNRNILSNMTFSVNFSIFYLCKREKSFGRLCIISSTFFVSYYTGRLEAWRRLQETCHQVPHQNIKFTNTLTEVNHIQWTII